LLDLFQFLQFAQTPTPRSLPSPRAATDSYSRRQEGVAARFVQGRGRHSGRWDMSGAELGPSRDGSLNSLAACLNNRSR
jgi:hypothetical protein